MRERFLFSTLLVAMLGCVPALPAHAQKDGDAVPAAAEAVREVLLDQAARARADALWGRPFMAPVALHDPVSGRSWRWRGDAGARFEPLRLPEGLPPANTCIELEGRPTALMVLPLPEGRDELAVLAWHELSHCMQRLFGLPEGREGGTAHLDSEQGRTWLRLELRALRRAVEDDDPDAMRAHLRAALGFRARREAVFPGALAGEAGIERNEGLAEANGHAIAHPGRDAYRGWLLRALESGDNRDSYVRSAAYLTGPAYGFLLDGLRPDWRRQFPEDGDLAALAAGAAGLPFPDAAGADVLAGAYGGDEVAAAERERERVRAAREQALRARLVDGPAIALPLARPSVSFDPRNLFPLGADGMVYHPVTLEDAWGRLESEAEVLLATDWKTARIVAEGVEGCGREWRGQGWRLLLADGWTLRPGDAGHGMVLAEATDADATCR